MQLKITHAYLGKYSKTEWKIKKQLCKVKGHNYRRQRNKSLAIALCYLTLSLSTFLVVFANKR